MKEIVVEVQTLAAMRPDLEPFKFPVAVNLKGLTGLHTANTISQSIGGIGVSPVPPQAKACGYHKLLFDCNSV
jgi:hypothetical protein